MTTPNHPTRRRVPKGQTSFVGLCTLLLACDGANAASLVQDGDVTEPAPIEIVVRERVQVND